jgi:hypothetical protein
MSAASAVSSVRLLISVAALAALALGACSSDDDDNNGGPKAGNPGNVSTGGASSQQVDACKASCDKMKFFDCSSASEQARCYNDCNTAAPDKIEVFVACAQNSICDPDCRTGIQPPPPAPPAPMPGQPQAPPSLPPGTGATAETCSAAADKLIACGALPAEAKPFLVQVCPTQIYEFQAACIANNACDKIASACGFDREDIDIDIEVDVPPPGGGGGSGEGSGPNPVTVLSCQSACSQLLTQQCVNAEVHAACSERCTKADEPKSDAFAACVRASQPPECGALGACLTAYNN